VLSRKSYSTKCDIWSIGVIYYEMLFHDVPWKGRDE
jgi:calcium-dependent protein kinase